MKANWEQFQKYQYRKKNKYMSNPRMRKLYDILESDTCNVNKIKQDVDSTMNQGLLRGIDKRSKEPKTIVERDVERIKNELFSKRDRCNDLRSKIASTTPSKESFKEDIVREEKRDIAKKRSLFTEKRLWNINDILSLESNLLNPHENDSSKGKISSGVKNEVEKYLNDCNTNIDELYGFKDKDLSGNLELSENDLNENIEKDFDYNVCINERDLDNLEKCEIETTGGDNDIEENGGSTSERKNVDTKSIETIDEKYNEKFSDCNAFVEMGFNGLNLSKDVLDQVLQSEYLKKDLLSLYPV